MYGRLIHRFWRPRVKLKSSPKLSKHTVSWQEPASRLPSMTGPFDFTFLNEKGNLIEVGWDGPSREKLWRYNQHYFDDLNAQNGYERKSWHNDLIEKWIVENPPLVGTGWESYPTSLRIVNWIKWNLGGNQLSASALENLFIQLRWLNKRLEYHLLGNHLLANAKALVFGGLFFEGKEAEKWLIKGLRILNREIEEQILPDGGHFELSTMYHALAFEDILDLLNITKAYSTKLSREQQTKISTIPNVAKSMHQWLKNMCHPDGEISFFNDSAFNVAPSVSELDSYFKRLEIENSKAIDKNLTFLKDSGYVRIRNGSAVAIMDVAKIGPDYLPGHGHADTLSFELSVDKQRVFVNSGTSCYGISAERLRQRGTHAHNTLVINGKDSSEVWAGFRVAKRANPCDIKVDESEDGTCISIDASHDGYKKIFNRHIIHRRRWKFEDNNLAINDKIDGKFFCSEVLFHLHPDVIVDIEIESNFSVGSILLSEGYKMQFSTDGRAKLNDSTWHPYFGVIQNCKVISVTFDKNEVNTIVSW